MTVVKRCLYHLRVAKTFDDVAFVYFAVRDEQLEVVSTNYLLICAEDRAHYQCMLVRLKKLKTRTLRRRSTIADSHALFDRIRVGPIASRQHWLKCKMHWFTSPESAKLYQAELEIKRRVGERPLKRWWKEQEEKGLSGDEDDRSNTYRIDFRANDLRLVDPPALLAFQQKVNEAEMEEWRKLMNPVTVEDAHAVGLTGVAFEEITGEHHKIVIDESLSGEKSSDWVHPLAQSERALHLPGAKDGSDVERFNVKGDTAPANSDESTAGDDSGRRLWMVPANLDDQVIANAYSIVKEINEVCNDSAQEGVECAVPQPQADTTHST